MPIYEYRCQSCGHELEKLQRMSDPELKDCPACGKAKLRRLISAAGFRLKGGGWYETDFKHGNKRNLAESSGAKSEAAAAEPSAGKSDAGARPEATAAGNAEKARPASADGAAKSTAGTGKGKAAGSGAAGTA
jgi:putative FmdB family regulatory protein